MKIESLFAFSEQLKKDHILYCYSGKFTRGIVEEIGGIIKNKIEMDTSNMSFSIKVFSIFVDRKSVV